jgi:plasmid stabilization system protein ParE
MPRLVLRPIVREDIRETLIYTRQMHGERQRQRYLELIHMALRDLRTMPAIGRPARELHPDAWVLHIAREGRGARHQFIYRIRVEVEVARFVSDAADIYDLWPLEWSK